MNRIFTSDASTVSTWTAAHLGEPLLVVSAMVIPPPAVFAAVATHGLGHLIIRVEDDAHVCDVLDAAVVVHAATIAAHLSSDPAAVVLIHCRKGKNRSTLLHFLLLWLWLRDASAADAVAMVVAGRLGTNLGVMWKPKEAVVDHVRKLAWKRAHGVAPVVPMTWPYGATAGVRRSFVRYMTRVAAREAAAEAAAAAAAAGEA